MKKNKAILSLLVGILALNVATVSMSIAWYANSATVYINAIDISFDTEKDLKIATEIDGNYQEHIDYQELNPTTVFTPISSSYQSKWMDNYSEVPLFYDESKYSTSNESLPLIEPVTEGYYSQEFYLLSDDDIYVSINPDNTWIKSNSHYNDAYAEELYHQYQTGADESKKDLTLEEIKARLNKIVDAMRISILVSDVSVYRYGIIDPNKEVDTYLGGLLDNNIDRYYDYYHSENDSTLYERVYGEIIGDRNNIIYDEPNAFDTGYTHELEEPSAFNARHKAGVKTFNESLSKLNGVEIKKENSFSLEDFNKASKPFSIPLNRNEPRRIVISIYIEGWDLESVNYTMGATFMASIGLRIERER